MLHGRAGPWNLTPRSKQALTLVVPDGKACSGLQPDWCIELSLQAAVRRISLSDGGRQVPPRDIPGSAGLGKHLPVKVSAKLVLWRFGSRGFGGYWRGRGAMW